MKKRHLIAVIMASVSLTVLAACGDSKTDTAISEQTAEADETPAEDTSDPETENDKEPVFVKDLFNSMETVDLDGNAVDTSLFSENKMTIVNVWNTGCNPCIHEIPVLDQLNTELADQGISIKGLIYEGTPGLSKQGREDVNAILEHADASYQHLLASNDMLNSPTLRTLTAFPTTYFVDPEGEIFASTVGARDYDGWNEVIDQALDLLEDHE